MSTTTVDLEQVGAQAEAELADARNRRERLSLDALAGDEAAAAELLQVEARIGVLGRKTELASLATGEKARREQIAAADAERERQDSARREAEAASARREKALQEVRSALAALSDTVERFLQYEAQLQDASVRTGERHVALAEPLGELIVMKLRDAGVPGQAFTEWIPAAYRKRLLDRFGELAPDDDENDNEAGEPATVTTCTVCVSDDRAAIEADLAAGVTLREIEQRHGVSRSAVSRHKRHGADEPEPAA